MLKLWNRKDLARFSPVASEILDPKSYMDMFPGWGNGENGNGKTGWGNGSLLRGELGYRNLWTEFTVDSGVLTSVTN